MADIKSHASLTTGLASYWDLEEASGTRYDFHGSNNLTDNTTVTQAAGKVGNGADFESDGSDSLEIADNASLSITGSLSISAWFKPESETFGGIVSKYIESGNERSYVLHHNATGTVSFRISSDGTTTNLKTITSATTLTNGVWYHITAVFTAGSRMEIFINGISDVADTTSIPASCYDSTAVFYIGRTILSGTSRFLDGIVDEVGLWSKALTSGEITDLYNSGNGLPYYDPTDIKDDATLSTSLVSYWKLDETSGTRNDSHGSNHLTDNNTVLYATGKIGNGADFESANSEYLSIADASQTGLDNQTNMSFSYWYKPESDTDGILFAKFATGSQGYWWQVQVGGSNNTYKFQDSSEGDSCVITGNTLTNGTWYHHVVTYEAGVVKFYENGTYVGTDTTSNSSIPNTTGYFSIGRCEKYNSNYIDGVIDEFAVWGKALTVAEVRALYGYGTPPEYDVVTGGGFTPTPMMHMMQASCY